MFFTVLNFGEDLSFYFEHISSWIEASSDISSKLLEVWKIRPTIIISFAERKSEKLFSESFIYIEMMRKAMLNLMPQSFPVFLNCGCTLE